MAIEPPATSADPTTPQRVRWLHVITFYALACGFSWPFFWWRDMHSESWLAWQAPGFLKTATYMWGPGLAALACFVIFRKTHRRRITLAGTSVARSLAFYLAPLLALAALGAEAGGMSGHLWPLACIVICLFTTFGEELGWRGFLQDALHPLSPVKRYILIGVMWEAWHFTNRTSHGEIGDIMLRLAIFYPFCILMSWLFGSAVERSKSILVAHTFHLWVNLAGETNYLEPSWQVNTVFVASIALWIWLLRGWPSSRREAPPAGATAEAIKS